MTEQQAAINKAVREAIQAALLNQGVERQKAHAAALMGMYAVQADLNGTEFHLTATVSTCPAMEPILGDSTGENAEVCGATPEAGEMFCSQHKEEN